MAIHLKKPDGMSDAAFLETHGTRLHEAPKPLETDRGFVVCLVGETAYPMASEAELAAWRDMQPKESRTRSGLLARTKEQHAAWLAQRSWYRLPAKHVHIEEEEGLPVLHGDGVSDDTAALQALAQGRAVRRADGQTVRRGPGGELNRVL